MATEAQVKAFIARVAPIAQAKAKGRDKWSLPSVCIAQCCCESSYGTSQKMMNANAILGVKVGKSKVHFGTAWKDKAYSTKTKECYDGKTYTEITDMFRAYDSIDDAIEDYYDMLASCSRYKGCLNQTDPKTCITAIKNGGYATSPTYITTIMSIINKYNLTQYDFMTESAGVIVPDKQFQIGRKYTLQKNMYIRSSAGAGNKSLSDLTVDGKKHAYSDDNGNAILKKGTTVTCKGVEIVNGATWIEIPSGWVCAIGASGIEYVK